MGKMILVSKEISLYSWIEFNFQELLVATVDQNMYAVTDNSNNILVWELHENIATLLTIIISPILVTDIKWIKNTQELAIIGRNECLIWDVFENKRKKTIKLKHDIYFIVNHNNKLVIYSSDNKLRIINDKKTIKVLFAWMVNDDVYYSSDNYLGKIDGSIINMDKKDINAKKQIEKQNKLNLKADVFIFGGEYRRTPNLRIPHGMKKYFIAIDLLIIHLYDKIIFYQSADFLIVTDRTKHPRGIIRFDGHGTILSEMNHLVVKSAGEEFISTKNILYRNLIDYILDRPLFFSNAPGYLFSPPPNTDFTHINKENGYFLVSDGINHTLFDIFKNESVEFAVSKYKRNIYVMIDEKREYLLEWIYGSSPPLGILRKRTMDNSVTILYNREKHEHVGDEVFLDKKKIIDQSHLIIPEWHSVSMNIKYGRKTVFKETLSLSSLYYLIHYWSKSENAARLEYKKYAETSNILVYGDLILDEHSYFGIAPLWTENDCIIVTVSYDKRCYIWKKGKTVPLDSFELGIPLILKISDNGRYIAALSVFSKEMNFLSKDKIELKSLYPHVRIAVYDIERQSITSKDIPISTHILKQTIDVSFHDGIVFILPSHIDINKTVEYHYEDTFKRKSFSKFKRYWVTHSSNTKLLQIKKGVEFPIDPHPEIRRELHFRPFSIYENVLVRKSDDIAIISALNVDTNHQLSPADSLSYYNSLKLTVPFSGGRMIPVHFKYVGDILENKHYPFEQIDEMPRFILHKISHKGERFKSLLKQVIQDNSYHDKNGIAYRSSKNMKTIIGKYIR